MEENTLFDFSVGVSFYAGDHDMWYQANVYAPDSVAPICTMGGYLGQGYPPSFPAGTQLSEEMKMRITAEVTSKVRPAWDKLLALIMEDGKK
jgi:hypothetical protein